MAEQTEQQVPASEIKKAESMLTPEQKVMSEARYEVRKNKDTLTEVGLSEDQVNKAAEMAGNKAQKEYQELINQNPWKTTTDILDQATAGFEGDDKLLADAYRSWATGFPHAWREKLNYMHDLLVSAGKSDGSSFTKTLLNMYQYNYQPSFIENSDGKLYAHSEVLGVKNRHVVDQNVTFNDPNGRETVSPSLDALKSIAQAFGAEVPMIGDQLDSKDRIETKVPGVFLTIAGHERGGPRVSVVFSEETLEKIVTLPHETK